MSSITFFFIFVCIIAVLFLAINFILAPRNPYYEKITAFECGFHSFLQTRSPFNISFFIYAILFLLFDLEIILLYPYAVSAYNNDVYGLIVMLIFSIVLTIGFVFEIGRGALKIESRQNKSLNTSYHRFELIANTIGRLSPKKVDISKANRHYSTTRTLFRVNKGGLKP